MKNPGIDVEVWERLNKKWAELEANGIKVHIEFKLVAKADNKEGILAIEVIQNIDDEIILEIVQRNAGEAYETLGIAELSMEQLVATYKKIMGKLHSQSRQADKDLVVTMSPNSMISGELRAYLEKPDSEIKSSVLVGYHHYYMLNALREKMIEKVGGAWTQVKAVYHSNALEFYFEY